MLIKSIYFCAFGQVMPRVNVCDLKTKQQHIIDRIIIIEYY